MFQNTPLPIYNLMFQFDMEPKNELIYCDFVAGSVIQATGILKFLGSLRTEILPGGCWWSCGGRTYPRINAKPPWGCRLILGRTWVSKGHQLFQFCQVPHFGGVKLQLLCGVRIELAVGSLPLPSLFGGEEKGVLQTHQPLGLEAEPRNRGLP